MGPLHVSLLPAVQDADDLYTVLGALQARAQSSIGYRILATVGLIAGGFLLPGAAGMASLCVAAVAGLATVGALADFAARSLLMDLVTLQEVIRPRSEPSDLLAYQLAQLLAAEPLDDNQEVH